jgi:hypothetical protein
MLLHVASEIKTGMKQSDQNGWVALDLIARVKM